jgi:UDP-N-acetylmuramate: L-alanyl-gamma-D-glutamyl-meso-diaminopimelate ligase
VTSIEFDHADIFADVTAVEDAFRKLVAIVPADGHLVARTDDPRVRVAIENAKCTVHRYGKGQQWDGRIEDVDTTTGRMRFTVLKLGAAVGEFESCLVGEHNLMNQVAVVAALAIEGHEPASLAPGSGRSRESSAARKWSASPAASRSSTTSRITRRR